MTKYRVIRVDHIITASTVLKATELSPPTFTWEPNQPGVAKRGPLSRWYDPFKHTAENHKMQDASTRSVSIMVRRSNHGFRVV